MSTDTTVLVMRIPTTLKKEFRAFANGNDRTISQEVRRLMTRELAKVSRPEVPSR